MDYWAKVFIVETYFRQKSIHAAQLPFKVRFGCREFPVQWSTDGSTSSEPMGLCITSIVKTLTVNHILDERNHQGHHTTFLLSETLLSTAHASLCDGEVRSLESTGSPCGEFWSQISTCILTGYRLNKSLHLTTWGSHPPHLKRIIGMATAAFPWPTDQPLVWPAVVAALTGLEPPRFLYVRIP